MAVDEGIVSPELMEKVSEIDMTIRHARRKILDSLFDEYRRKGKVPDNIEGLCKKSFGDK
ncbi:MAG TPA: hypothetical protein ENG51_22150 [Deltaproteobacteria bacterium]|nr:hypothetical protein [Deltaproteobacteria bacterium]